MFRSCTALTAIFSPVPCCGAFQRQRWWAQAVQGGKGANGHGCRQAGRRVAAEQEEAAIRPLTVFSCAASPFMPANRRWLSLDRRSLLSSPAQPLCKQQLAGFEETVLVSPPLVKLQNCAQIFRLQYNVFLSVRLENNSIGSSDRESIVLGNDTKGCPCF